jgi:hypothetical protein
VTRVVKFGLDHPVLSVFAVALVLRFLVACGVSTFLSASPIQDDAGYAAMAEVFARGESHLWDPFTYQLFWSNASYLVPLTCVFLLSGSVYLAGQWMVALVGAAAAALVAALARRFLNRPLSLGAGLAVALLPSQVFFSSLTLKDAFVWAGLVLIGVALAKANGESRWRALAAWGLVAASGLAVLSRLRPHTTIVAALALAIAAWFHVGPRRRQVIAAAGLLWLGVPWVAGLGPGGVGYVLELGSVADYREAQATGATAIVRPPVASASPKPSSDGGNGNPSGGRSQAPSTGGLGENPSPAEPPEATRNLSHLPRGVTVMLFEPVPWRQAHNAQMMLAKVEMLVWYPLVGLAALGGWQLVTRRFAGFRPFLAFPLLAGGGSMLVAALGEGNFGTAYRHRGEFVWAVALFAAFGVATLLAARRSADPLAVQPASAS